MMKQWQKNNSNRSDPPVPFLKTRRVSSVHWSVCLQLLSLRLISDSIFAKKQTFLCSAPKWKRKLICSKISSFNDYFISCNFIHISRLEWKLWILYISSWLLLFFRRCPNHFSPTALLLKYLALEYYYRIHSDDEDRSA